MAKDKNEPKPVAKEEKADELIVKPGMRFVARKDCFISGVHKEGELVEFAPGQKAPMNLVALVGEAEQGEETPAPVLVPAAGETDPGAEPTIVSATEDFMA